MLGNVREIKFLWMSAIENGQYSLFDISQYELRDRDWSKACHVMRKSKQCCPVSPVQRHVPWEHGVNYVAPCICVDFLVLPQY